MDFPSEKQIAAHQAKLDELIAALDGVAQRRYAAVNTGPAVYVALELDQRIILLQYTARNLERIIRGERLGFPEGGIAEFEQRRQQRDLATLQRKARSLGLPLVPAA